MQMVDDYVLGCSMAVPMQVRVPERPRGDMDSLAESGRIRASETSGEAVASEARVREVPRERRGNVILPEVRAAPSFHSRRGSRGRRKAVGVSGGLGTRRDQAKREGRRGRGAERVCVRSTFGPRLAMGRWMLTDQLDDGGRPVGYRGREAFPDGLGPGGPPRAAAKDAKREGLESACRVNSVPKVSTPGKARPDRGAARGVGAARERGGVQENGREGDFHSFV